MGLRGSSTRCCRRATCTPGTDGSDEDTSSSHIPFLFQSIFGLLCIFSLEAERKNSVGLASACMCPWCRFCTYEHLYRSTYSFHCRMLLYSLFSCMHFTYTRMCYTPVHLDLQMCVDESIQYGAINLCVYVSITEFACCWICFCCLKSQFIYAPSLCDVSPKGSSKRGARETEKGADERNSWKGPLLFNQAAFEAKWAYEQLLNPVIVVYSVVGSSVEILICFARRSSVKDCFLTGHYSFLHVLQLESFGARSSDLFLQEELCKQAGAAINEWQSSYATLQAEADDAAARAKKNEEDATAARTECVAFLTPFFLHRRSSHTTAAEMQNADTSLLSFHSYVHMFCILSGWSSNRRLFKKKNDF